MDVNEVREILKEVEFKEVGSIDYEFVVGEKFGEAFLQAQYWDTDVVTGKKELQKTRKWPISQYAVKSEVVTTALKCVLTSVEHRVRENFKYRGKRIFGPHFDVDALWEIADKNVNLDYRGNPAREKKRVEGQSFTQKYVILKEPAYHIFFSEVGLDQDSEEEFLGWANQYYEDVTSNEDLEAIRLIYADFLAATRKIKLPELREAEERMREYKERGGKVEPRFAGGY